MGPEMTSTETNHLKIKPDNINKREAIQYFAIQRNLTKNTQYILEHQVRQEPS
jgi:hypothetical protein